MRLNNRANDELRNITITRDYNKYAEGSVLIAVGDTKIICTASIEEKLPPFLKDSGQGWITSEYSMLPRSTGTRMIRESSRGKVGGRTQEIQRLIGRALRAVVDLKKIGERTIWIDCDVIQADGGTRTASITGGFIALADALHKLKIKGLIQDSAIKDYIAATSVGIVNGEILLDLNYTEDSKAEVDMNFIITGGEKFIEIQGTAESEPFSMDQLHKMIEFSKKGIHVLIEKQKAILGNILTNNNLLA